MLRRDGYLGSPATSNALKVTWIVKSRAALFFRVSAFF